MKDELNFPLKYQNDQIENLTYEQILKDLIKDKKINDSLGKN